MSVPRWSTIAFALLVACKRDPVIDVSAVSFHAASASRDLGTAPHDVACVDADGDGRSDVVMPIDEHGGLVTMLGDGKGGFANAQVPGPRTPGQHTLVVTDLEPDGRIDYVSAHHDSHDVGVLLGAGHGTDGLRLIPARTEGKPHNHGLAAADFDGDGDLDILTSDQDAGSVALLVGDGRGDFAIASGSPWPIGEDPYPPAVGDLDGDGDPDVASPLVSAAAIGVLLGDGKGGFTPGRGAPGPLTPRPYSIALGDIDGDGKLDAVVAHDDVEIASLLIGDGKGGFTRDSELELGGRGSRMKLVDVDGNGALDLVASSYPSSILLMLGDGKGRFAHASGSPYAIGGDPAGVAVCDVNGDRKLDLVAVSSEAKRLSVWLRD